MAEQHGSSASQAAAGKQQQQRKASNGAATDSSYYTQLTKEAYSVNSPSANSPAIGGGLGGGAVGGSSLGNTRSSSFSSPAHLRDNVRDYIGQLRQDPSSLAAASAPNGSGEADNNSTADNNNNNNNFGDDDGEGEKQPSPSTSLSNMAKRRHLHLPPISELEAYVLDGNATDSNADNLLNILPDIVEALASYVQTYPEQVRAVWQNLKPILKDVRRRNRLHGRHIMRPTPPICPKIPSQWTTMHGDVVHDDYAWLRDKDNPEVMKYLEAENEYGKASLAHTRTLQKVLFKEFVSRLNENEESARVTLPDGWGYFTRKIPGAEYRLHCRVDRNGFEEMYLDENVLAKQGDPAYFNLGFLRHTADCKLIAYGTDTSGIERYTAYFMDMDTKQVLPDVIPDCYEDFEFSTCGRYAFYILIDQYERAYQLKRHELGKPVEEDLVLYEEKDEMFCLTMTKSCNKRYLLLHSAAQITSETLFLDLNDLDKPLRVLFPRREKVNYVVEHHSFADAPEDSQDYRGYFYIMSNENSKNNQLLRVPVPTEEEWRGPFQNGIGPDDMNARKEVVIANRDFVLIEAFHLRARHLIVFERSNCMQIIRIVNLIPDTLFESYHYVSFPEGVVYSVWPGSVDEEVADLSKSTLFDTNLLRFTYTSFTQPKQVIDYNMDTRSKTVVHEEKVLGPGYDASLYVSKRLWATGTDGTSVPISLVYRRDLLGMNATGTIGNTTAASSLGLATSANQSDANGTLGESGSSMTAGGAGTPSGTANGGPTPAVLTGGNPLLLHGYGAYGSCVTPIFSTSRLSLLDRGFVYATAHVRGGSDMGNGWYLEGKLGKKPNTFLDFISCAEYLIKEGYTTPEKLAIYGRSAGGLLIGAVVNMRPELFKAVLTEVPFVDVINTMFDSTIPWTAFEYEEWGNPSDQQICDAMKSYCPYSNIIPGHVYPNMLVVGGMNDPRVAYFEPAKWTAKLRATARWTKLSKTAPVDAGNQENTNGEDSNAHHQSTDSQQQTENVVDILAKEDRLLLLRIQEAGHSGSSGQYSHLEDLAFEYAFLISTLGAQFRPVSSGGRSMNGVDYDMYWEELEHEQGEEEEEEEEEGEEEEETEYDATEDVTEASTKPMPLRRRLSDFWARRRAKKALAKELGKKERAQGGSRAHSRSSSIITNGIKGLLRGRNSNAGAEEDGDSSVATATEGTLTTAVAAANLSSPLVMEQVPEDEESNPSALRPHSESRANRSTTRISPNGTVHGSKASLRYPYPADDSSGRVQSVGKNYTFWSRFF